MKAVVKVKHPLFTAKHHRVHLDWALVCQNWTLEDWKKVVWSDKPKINCLESDGRKWVWKKKGESLSDRLISGTLKFGGSSLMIWGCMFWEGCGYACQIEGKMDADLYVGILEENLEDSLEYYRKERGDFFFFSFLNQDLLSGVKNVLLTSSRPFLLHTAITTYIIYYLSCTSPI
jgi:hypothetical protein